MVEPRRSWGPMLECRRVGRPLPGVPPGEEAQEGAMRIFGVISVLSESRRLGNTLPTRRKLLSGDDGEQPNHQPPSMPEPGQICKDALCRITIITNIGQLIRFNNVLLCIPQAFPKYFGCTVPATVCGQVWQCHVCLTLCVCVCVCAFAPLSLSRTNAQSAVAAAATTACDSYLCTLYPTPHHLTPQAACLCCWCTWQFAATVIYLTVCTLSCNCVISIQFRSFLFIPMKLNYERI